jgi:hypothetical protein
MVSDMPDMNSMNSELLLEHKMATNTKMVVVVVVMVIVVD